MTINVLDKDGNPVALQTPNANGRAAATSSAPITLSTEDKAALDLLHSDLIAATPAGTAIIGKVGIDQTTPGGTNRVSLASDIVSVSVVGGQLGETLWTDDTGAYFVRLDSGGTVTFYPPTGGVAVTPGAGLRPSGDAATVDKTSYTVSTGGTGYALGDLIDHLVAIDRKTGAVITNQWLNSTQATVLTGAPSAANIVAIGTGTQQVAGTVVVTGVAQEGGGNLAALAAVAGAKTDVKSVATDATPASLPALLKGVIDRIGALVALLPTSLGAKTKANSLSVTMASDQTPVPDTVIAATTLDPTGVGNLISVTPNGNGTVTMKIGTLGTAFPGGTVIVFEKVGVPGAAALGVNVYPRGAANGGRIKSTSVGGEFIFPSEGAVSVQARVSVAGTGSLLNVTAQVAAPAAIQPVVPVNIGQTTRAYAFALGQRVAFSATDASLTAIAASEVLLHAKGGSCYFNLNAAATVGAGSVPLEAGEKFHLQITPGDVLHVIQDSGAGFLVAVPVA